MVVVMEVAGGRRLGRRPVGRDQSVKPSHVFGQHCAGGQSSPLLASDLGGQMGAVAVWVGGKSPCGRIEVARERPGEPVKFGQRLAHRRGDLVALVRSQRGPTVADRQTNALQARHDQVGPAKVFAAVVQDLWPGHRRAGVGVQKVGEQLLLGELPGIVLFAPIPVRRAPKYELTHGGREQHVLPEQAALSRLRRHEPTQSGLARRSIELAGADLAEAGGVGYGHDSICVA